MSHLRRSVTYAIAAMTLFVAVPLSGCTSGRTFDSIERSVEMTESTKTVGGDGVSTIYLAGGCFWGLEKYMAGVNGVLEAEAGYANGTVESPTYRDVTTGLSGYAETVRVEYDPEVAPLPFLLDLFYDAIDPTTLNRQGNDRGTQYRSGIYYVDEANRPLIERSLARLQEQYDKPIAVESGPLTAYTSAEEYHQDYLDKNPGGYCHIGLDLFEKAANAVPDPSQFPEAENDVR
ncbi:MAG: peptide-methionine (S)-S-oxide reductase MsrA [Actinomycetota bacterium]|jgi:peptide methionine sulfoxide reductase msrA/msrB|nr:peptide-methionine (S)-S-oxide reductase MsrA [Actinomycetota bacterium]